MAKKRMKRRAAAGGTARAHPRARGFDADLEIRRGIALQSKGRPGEAAEIYRKVLEVFPGHPECLHLMGLAAHQAGDHPRAEALIRRAIKARPRHADYHYNLGKVLKARERLEEAAASYKAALRLNPRDPEAANNLGNLLVEMKRPREAVARFKRAVQLRPDYLEAYLNLAGALNEVGEPDEAEATLERAIETDPRQPHAHHSLGVLLDSRGRPEEAAERFARAVELDPDFWPAHYSLGNVLLKLLRTEEAIASYENALRLNPDHAPILNNLGNALNHAGRIDEATGCYRNALSLEPDFAQAHYNLAGALVDSRGVSREAVSSYASAARLAPSEARYLEGMSRALRLMKSPPVEGFTRRELAAWLSMDGYDRRGISRVAQALIKEDSQIEPLVRLAQEGCYDELAREIMEGRNIETLADPLVLRVLENSLITDPGLESLMTSVRRVLLERAHENRLPRNPEDGMLELAAGLAHQCFNNEYVFYETKEEARIADELCRRLDNALSEGGAVDELQLALAGAYRPLFRLKERKRLARMAARAGGGPLKGLLLRQVAQPAEEMDLIFHIPSLTGTEHPVSRSVRAQYEENPYPRWMDTPCARPMDLATRLTRLAPHLDEKHLARTGEPSVLVAGCGTGREAIHAALCHPGGRVTAVDLSLASLAYGLRMARSLGVSNIEFFQGDILELGSLGPRFDVIECCGVLHHLEDPAEGLRILTGCLNPGGYMKLGLYSRLARRKVEEARNFAGRRGFDATVGGIRGFRREVLSLPRGHGLKEITLSDDFYSTSMCRDLIFHVQEASFTLPEIKGLIEGLGLVFLCFEMPDRSKVATYLERFPRDPAAASFDLWHQYETENPDTFSGMYQFWVRKG